MRLQPDKAPAVASAAAAALAFVSSPTVGNFVQVALHTVQVVLLMGMVIDQPWDFPLLVHRI